MMNKLRSNVRFFSATKFVLRKEWKWSNSEPMTHVEKKKKAAVAIKRHNWENVNLYGPTLDTASERKSFLKNKRADAERAFTYTAVVHNKEAGFKDCDEFTPSSERKVKVRIVAHPSERDTLREFNLETPKHQNDEPKNVDNVVPEKKNGTRTCNTGDVWRTASRLDAHDMAPLALPPSTTRLLEHISSLPLLNTQEDASSNKSVLLDDESCEMLTSRSSSVSTILQETMPAKSLLVLERWKRKMVALLGEDGFRKYQQEMFRVGSCLHRCIEDFLSEKPLAELEIDDSIRGHWKSLQPVLANISDVFLLETKVQHPVLHYRGILDCVVKYRGTNVLLEWKTSQHQKPQLRDTYDNPLQALAYVGALNYTGNLEFQLTEAAIVVVYPCGSPAHVHFLNKDLCQHYWNLWLQRFAKFLSSC